MRIHHLLLLAALSFTACSKHDTTPATPPAPPLIYKYTAAIPPFFSTPLATNQLQLTFPTSYHIAQVFLKKDTTVLGQFPVTRQSGNDNANITYPFEPGQQYSFIVESAPADGIVIRYALRNYTHTYITSFTFQQLLSLTQSLGLNEFDISPSRKTLFITDDEHNWLITKRLSLTDGSIDSSSGVPYGVLRAISDSELLVSGSSYNGRFPGGDTAILARYNLYTKKTSFVAFVSANYSRISRIIDNHLLITQPLYPGNSQLISLVDTSTTTYPYSSVNFVLIGTNNFDHLYYRNQIVDPITGTFHNLIPATDSAGIEVTDNATGYTITSWYSPIFPDSVPPVGYYKSHLGVYAHGNSIYQSNNLTNCSFNIPRQTSITNNRLVFYESFGWDTTFHISGYYQLDLNTKTTTLLHCYSTPYGTEDFQLDPHTIISVHADGVYRVTLP
ncbi:hypothetical protein [Puia dinghuensis]|uniref:hypothetical protein n=1 Tax=Puia dinghuensis TaxID=1792502 RepID=UPI0016667166|nr:hypothetical protein [Puia dinghuensis]